MSTLTFRSTVEWLPKLILSISLLHISACVLFILGYSFGFGANIISVFEPEDIFRVGLKDLVLVYLTACLVPAVGKLTRLRSDKPYAQDFVEQIEDQSSRAKALESLGVTRKLVTLSAYCIIAIATIGAIYSFWIGNPAAYVLATWPIFILLPLWQEKIKSALKIDHQVFEAIDFLAILFLSALAFGAYIGQGDRAFAANALTQDTIFCENYAIVRSVSDLYIAKDGSTGTFLLDAECQVVFTIPPR